MNAAEVELTEEELAELANFKPIFTDEEMHKTEENLSHKNVGVSRRLVLLACSRSAEILSEFSIDQPEAFTEMAEQISYFKTYVEDLLELAVSADIRMAIANCRESKENEMKNLE